MLFNIVMTTASNTIGVVLLNLGGPDSLDAVRPFLYNLFSDRDIIRLGPSILQKPIAWFISTFRSQHTREMYREIGNKSPILDITSAQARALEEGLKNTSELNYKVYIAMRYWRPFTRDTVDQIVNDNVDRLVVLTLYPHYSKATTGSSLADLHTCLEGKGIDALYINEWYDNRGYIDALAELIAEGIAKYEGNPFHLLFSAHSLPQSFIDEGDPYLDHIKSTIDNVLNRLSEHPYNLPGLEHQLAFQSKTGPVKWLEPSTEEAIIQYAKSGGKELFVVPISFVSDHIETLYEIDIQYRELAQQHGVNLSRCKALNTSEKFIDTLKQLVLDKIKEQDR